MEFVVLFAIFGVISCERMLQFPGRNEKLKMVLMKKWEIYYECLKESNQNLNEIRTHFVLPGQSARMNCTECRKPFDDASTYTWKQRAMDFNSTIVDFENLPEAFTLRDFNDLVVRNARPEYSGIYQCFRGAGYLSTHIIEIPEHTAIVPVNHSEQIYEKINNSSELVVEWREWSKCSKCENVGKRFQYGICAWRADESYPFHELSCFSRFLDKVTQNAVLTTGATNFAVVEPCKDDCESNENMDIKEKREHILGLFRTALKREIINAHPNQFLILQCPGVSDENIPVTWKVLNMEIIPETIEEQTKGRIKIDLLNRLQFRETKQQDSLIYSCWQQEKLIGIIHLDVEQKTKEYGKWMPIFTALSIIFLAVHIGMKALKHKK